MKKTTILIIVLDILALIGFFLFYGPIKSIRVWWINTAMNTMTHQYFAYIFYSEEMIIETMSQNYYIPLKEEVNLDDIVIDTSPKENYENKYDEQILTRNPGNDDYKLINLEIEGYEAFLVAIYDPSKVKVISKQVLATGGRGENMVSMCQRTGSKVCINAGGFMPDSNDMSTDIPSGYIIQDGEIIYSINSNAKGRLIGFNKDNKLVLATATGAEALEMGIRDAVEFGPFLIINGKAIQAVGNGGFGSAPRVAIAQRKDGVVLFLVTNARNFYGGPSLDGVVKTLQRYGAYNAANLDGGASTTLVIKNQLINTPRNAYSNRINPRSVVTGFALTK